MKVGRSLLLLLALVFMVACTCGLWVWQAKRQYAINRELIAALVHNDSKQALALINAGADPNTRYNPPPAPTLKLLLSQLLHRSLVPADISPTAFLLVCGEKSYSLLYYPELPVDSPENMALIGAMLSHGADVRARDMDNSSALHGAVSSGYPDVALLLLEHGANINAQNKEGSPPLVFAVIGSDMEMTRLLLEHHASVFLEDNEGQTILHNALAYDSSADIFHQLLTHGADSQHPDKHGNTPLMLAQQMNRPDIVALLRQKR